MHAYVDDVVVKTKQSGTLLDNLKETFANLRCYRMKLNPEKCTFGVPAGQLLGYIISQRGIEANPSKIKAIEDLEPPTKLRDMQKFAGCLASLSRFICRLGEKAMPLYQLMKKTDHFVWPSALMMPSTTSSEPCLPRQSWLRQLRESQCCSTLQLLRESSAS
jgi:hypothetical protein